MGRNGSPGAELARKRPLEPMLPALNKAPKATSSAPQALEPPGPTSRATHQEVDVHGGLGDADAHLGRVRGSGWERGVRVGVRVGVRARARLGPACSTRGTRGCWIGRVWGRVSRGQFTVAAGADAGEEDTGAGEPAAAACPLGSSRHIRTRTHLLGVGPGAVDVGEHQAAGGQEDVSFVQGGHAGHVICLAVPAGACSLFIFAAFSF